MVVGSKEEDIVEMKTLVDCKLFYLKKKKCKSKSTNFIIAFISLLKILKNY